VKVLVTGADGFVGRRLVRALLGAGHEVTAACRPGGEPAEQWLGTDAPRVRTVVLEVDDAASVQATVAEAPDAVMHLAAVSSTTEARRDVGHAWRVNAVGTALLLDALAGRPGGPGQTRVLIVSSAEVYGPGSTRLRAESDPLAPVSVYAATKAAAEIAGFAAWRRTGLRVTVARAFPHTGAGQAHQFVVPAFLARIRAARRSGARTVATGNLEPVRDLLDVRDVVAAYVALLDRGAAGEVYNVARGEGVTIRDLFERLAGLLDAEVEPVPDEALVRTGDIPHLVGDPTKLERATGWCASITLDETLRGVVNAEAD
jgi:GDP-4-dehydro-6-deoxy-D-mannose reductase